MSRDTPPPPELVAAEQALVELASAFPEATMDYPWGHRAFKVRGKAFMFMGTTAESLSLSLKLPRSSVLALELPFTEPTGYGLGKSGWVSASFERGDDVPLPLIAEWLEESYAAIAPKTLARQRAAGATSEAPVAKKKTAKKKTAKKKTAKKKTAKKKS